MLSLSKFFSPILLSCTSKSADDLMDHFNSPMLDIMDNIAPFLNLRWLIKIRKLHGSLIDLMHRCTAS